MKPLLLRLTIMFSRFFAQYLSEKPGAPARESLSGLGVARISRSVLIVAAVLLTALWGFIYADLKHERRIHVDQAQRDTENLAIAFENNVESTIVSIDALLISLRHELLENADLRKQKDIVDWVHRGPLKDSIVQIGVVDRDGYLVYTSANESIKPIFVGDREHFRAHVDALDDRLFISKPIRARTTDQDLIPFSRRVMGPDGVFRGVVSVLVRSEHFASFYNSIQIGRQGAVSLVRDGIVMARASAEPPATNPVGIDVSSILPGPGVMTDTRVVLSPVDGLTRLRHFRRLKDHPLAVVVSLTEADYLAEYHHSVTTQAITGLASSLVIIGFTLLLVIFIRRIEFARRLAIANESRMRSLIDAVPDLIFFKDKNSVYTGCNTAFSRFAGRTENEQIGKSDSDFFESGVAKAFRENDQAMFTSGEARRNEEWVTYPDGHTALLDTLKAPFFGAKGEPLGLIGISRDITDRKRAEENLLLANSVFESTNEGIMVTDTRSHILMVNPAFTEITGWRSDEVLGEKPSLLKSGRHSPGFYAEMWQALHELGHWEGEVWNRRKNGEIYAQWMIINAIRDAGNAVTRYVSLFTDITQRKKQEENIWRQANFDSLTGLANRHLFYDRLDHALAGGRRHGQQIGLMFLDLDEFKEVNDSLGHEAGDLLLIEAAQRLEGCVREEDTVARLGGDEFTIIVQSFVDHDPMTAVAEKVLAALATPFIINGTLQKISGSIGMTLFPIDAENASDLLRCADIAMYQAKAAGRNRYQFYSAAMPTNAACAELRQISNEQTN